MSLADSIASATVQGLARYPIISEGCVVAVSGGPDSVGLLHAVYDVFSAAGSSACLVLAHMNHGLRGAESDADEQFVRGLFATLTAGQRATGLKLACTSVDVTGQAHCRKQNLEAVARGLRYDWLAEQARVHAVRWVLTAHTLNDQAETTLFHILRGTGIQGLRGMHTRRRLAPGIWLVRPWLSITKTDVLEYLKDRGLSFRLDSSNHDPRFTRNRLRHELLPKLQSEFNPRIQHALAGLARQAEEAGRLIDRQARSLLRKAERPRVERLLILDLTLLKPLTLELLQSLYAYVWRRESWPRGNMGRREWRVLAMWTQGNRRAVDLPDGIRAVKKRGIVQLGPCK